MDGFSLAASVIAAIQPDARNTLAPIILVPLEDRRIPTLKPISRPCTETLPQYSNMAFCLCSSLQELRGEDPTSFYSIPVLCGCKLFIGGDVASSAQLQLCTP
jgi:hypothetical protein